MKLIADTSVWSLFLRRARRSSSEKVGALRTAISEGNVNMLGIIRQELLTGIREPEHFARISDLLEGFPDMLATSADHLVAAQFYNTCRSRGVQGSPVDFLICAQAYHQQCAILTMDRDFLHYAKHLPIQLA